jgi:hypothetical protein
MKNHVAISYTGGGLLFFSLICTFYGLCNYAARVYQLTGHAALM